MDGSRGVILHCCVAACLASLSASSFPGIPQWPGIQETSIGTPLCHFASSAILFRKKLRSCWPGVLQKLVVALIAARLSEVMETSSKKSNCRISAAANISPTSSASYTMWCLSDPKWC